MLTLFSIHRAKDSSGKDIIPEVGLKTGLSSHPNPYECEIKLRNDSARALVAEIKAELLAMD